ncbi:MAG: universal stress protein [Rhizobiaceae bacterium]
MVSKRLSRESGHRRKFLVIVDETPECERAVAYAARRATSTGGSVVLLFVIDSADFQGLLGVGKVMRAEAIQRATMTVERHALRVRERYGLEAESVLKEGPTKDEIHRLIEEDQDIAILVLAAGGSKEGPGPLVQAVAGRGAAFPIPVTVVPHTLTDEDIDAVA